MKQLRETTIRRIIAALDQSIFTKYAFDTTFNNSKTEDLIRIIFRYNPTFMFIVKEDKNKAGVWNVIESPSLNFVTPEATEVQDFKRCIDGIPIWIARLLEECTVGSSGRSTIIEKMRDNLNEQADELPNPDKPFTREEAATWENRLDTLVAEFEQLKSQDKVQQRELDSLKREVNELKANIETVPKRIWLKSAGNKILTAVEALANSKTSQMLAEGTVKLLLSGA